MPTTVQGIRTAAQRRQMYNMLDDISHLIHNGKQQRGLWQWEMTSYIGWLEMTSLILSHVTRDENEGSEKATGVPRERLLHGGSFT